MSFNKFKIFLCVMAGFLSSCTNKDVKKVCITKVADHPALDKTVEGIIYALAQEGFIKGQTVDIKIESAQGNSATASQIASKFVHSTPDVVVGVGTIAAQSFMPYVQKEQTKLVFSSITNPYKADLLANDALFAKNVTGVSNFIPLKEQIVTLKEILPTIKNLGILYNEGELNSVALVDELEKVCELFDVKLIKQTVSKTADVPQAAVKLCAQVEAIFITNDSTALSTLQSIVKAALERLSGAIPVFVSDTDILSQGALAAFGPNQFDIGCQTGKMIASLLNGKDTSDLPLEYPSKIELHLNSEMAKKLGITFSNDLKEKASLILGDEQS